MNREIEIGDHRVDVGVMRAELIKWGKENFRDYPWRHTSNLYHLLMAEFMLMRTQADQVVPVYLEFIDRFPDVFAVARASREEVARVLYPLGLRWRADNVYESAQILTKKYDGIVPTKFDLLVALPGVSQYIAAAVLCFGAGGHLPLIDTNTVRIAGRLFAIEINDSSRRSKQFRELLDRLNDRANPRVYNFALLDLGALVCTARRPRDCPSCPLIEMCSYGSNIQNIT